MNRYIIVIPAKNRSFLLKCDEGDGAKLETLQKLVSGYVETVPAALDATWAREEADRLVLEVATIGLLVTLGAVVTQNPVLTRIAQGLGVLGLLLLMYFHIG